MLDLLQHRIGQPVDIGIAGQQQHRQTVGMRHGGGRDHVGGPWPDGRRGNHDLAAQFRLGKGDGRKRHGLLVLPAPGGKLVLHLDQRFRKTGHVAVPEDPEDAREQRNALAVDHGELAAKVAHESLSHRQAYGIPGHQFLLP